MARRKRKSRRAKKGPLPRIPFIAPKGKISVGGVLTGNAMLQIATGWGLWNPKGTATTKKAGEKVAFLDTIALAKANQGERIPEALLYNSKQSVTTWQGFKETWGTAIIGSMVAKAVIPMLPTEARRYISA